MTTTTTNSVVSKPTTVIARSHLGYLDGLRGSAALFILLHHAWLQAGLPFYIFGHYAVGLFIVLSGFCLMLPVAHGNGILPGGALLFFKKRARRILPPYYLAMGISLLLVWLLIGKQIEGYYDESFDVNIKGIITHLFLVHDVFLSTSTQINGPFWSIAVEWRIYFLFPLLVMMFRKQGPFITCVLIIIVSALLSFLFLQTHINMGTHGVSPQYITLFVLGMLGADIVFSKKPQLISLQQRFPWTITVFGLSLLLIILAKVKPYHGELVPPYITDYVVGLWSMALLVSISRDTKSLLHRIFSWKPLVFIGTFAYSIYLIHIPLLHLFWQYAVYPLNLQHLIVFILLCGFGVPVIIFFCYLFYLTCEHPFITYHMNTKTAQTVLSQPKLDQSI